MFGIPVYLYEAAATQPHRKKLSQIRDGEYEHLAEKIVKPEWRPDYGPASFIPEYGATVVGSVRFFEFHTAYIVYFTDAASSFWRTTPTC